MKPTAGKYEAVMTKLDRVTLGVTDLNDLALGVEAGSVKDALELVTDCYKR